MVRDPGVPLPCLGRSEHSALGVLLAVSSKSSALPQVLSTSQPRESIPGESEEQPWPERDAWEQHH